MKETVSDACSLDSAHSLGDDSKKAGESFVNFNPEEEKLLKEIRAGLDDMKKKETAMETLLQELLAANKTTHAALAAYSNSPAPAAP